MCSIPMQAYFDGRYVSGGYFFVADAHGLYCVTPSGEQIWTNHQLGIDGVVITGFEGTSIWREGEWDLPGGGATPR